MEYFWQGLGTALVILAFAIGFKGCIQEEKPFFGINGSIIATQPKVEIAHYE